MLLLNCALKLVEEIILSNMYLRTAKLNYIVVFQVMTPLVSPLTNCIIRADVFQNAVVAGYVTVQVEAECSSETLVPLYQAA